jgi:hypothetical protein
MTLNRLPIALLLLLVAFAFFFYGIYAMADTGKEGTPALDSTTKATSRYLPVVFASHDKHAKDYNIGCTKCHHDIAKADEKPASCKSCHDEKGAEVDMKKAMHTSCLGCHKSVVAKKAESQAPVQCLACHRERK